MKNIFVTVGTTKFPKLVNAITNLDTIETFRKLQCTNIQIQTGQDFCQPNIDPHIENVSIEQNGHSWVVELEDYNMKIKYDQYFENFEEQIKKADLVISHAGAGSCLDVLRLNKPLVVVINEDLMNNHQLELAKQLQRNGHLYFCTCGTLVNALQKDFNGLKPYPKPNDELFSNYLDKCCGFG